MDKFASRAMLQIIEAGIVKLQLDLAKWEQEEHHIALVNKSTKTNLLSYIANQYDLETVARLADGSEDITDDPLRVALLKATSPEDLLERWSRIQEHVHSNHRIRWQSSGDKEILLLHVSLDDYPPLPEETCFVMAVLMKLMHLVGVKDINLQSNDDEITYQKEKWVIPHPPTPLKSWTLKYQLKDDCERHFEESTSFAQRITEIVRDDPCKKWTLDVAARILCVSSRTLQRRLKGEHKSFQRIVSLNRASIASDILTSEAYSLAEIGFLCGYSSSSHFSTSFLKETAFTPKEFRNQFQVVE